MSKKLVAFDMDGTLINGRLVFALGDKVGVSERVREIMYSEIAGYKKTEAIAQLWKGLAPADVVSAIAGIPLMDGAEEVVKELKSRGHIAGIVSDSYTLATGYIANKLDMDFHFSNVLAVKDDLLTGEVSMLLGWDKIGCDCRISVCKRFHLEKAAGMHGIAIKDTVAIGDTQSDICMIRRAGTGVAFDPKDDAVASSTDKVVRKPDLREILKYL